MSIEPTFGLCEQTFHLAAGNTELYSYFGIQEYNALPPEVHSTRLCPPVAVNRLFFLCSTVLHRVYLCQSSLCLWSFNFPYEILKNVFKMNVWMSYQLLLYIHIAKLVFLGTSQINSGKQKRCCSTGTRCGRMQWASRVKLLHFKTRMELSVLYMVLRWLPGRLSGVHISDCGQCRKSNSLFLGILINGQTGYDRFITTPANLSTILSYYYFCLFWSFTEHSLSSLW